jgi:KDO2-lipid IV(A) lauroyltransferase
MKLLLANIFLYSFGALPFSVAHRFGHFIGWLLYISNSKLKRTTEINLKLCFPDMLPQQRAAITKQVLKEKAKELTESPAIWTKPKKILLKQFTQISGLESLMQDFEKDNGVILLGAHMGAFYLANVYFGPKLKATWLYKPQKGIVEQLSKNKRNAHGAKFVPTDKTGVMAVTRALLQGGAVGMSCDHDAGSTGGIFARFFNIPAWTMGLPAKLANKSNAPVYFIFVERLAPGKGFHLHIIPVNKNIHHPDLLTAVSAMNNTLENCIKQHITQYDWTYKRFRRRPENEHSIY